MQIEGGSYNTELFNEWTTQRLATVPRVTAFSALAFSLMRYWFA